MTRVLIIDDEKRLRDNLAEMLELHGYECMVAQDGIEGLAKALSVEPDIILCDVMMPNATGHEFIANIKKTSQVNIPVILISAKAEREDERLGMSLGADDYITKPFNIKEVVTSIEARLSKAQQINHIISQYSNQSTYELSKLINGHEIRTALNIISGMNMLMNEMVEPASKKQAELLLQQSQSAIYGITSLTNNIYVHELLKSDIHDAIFVKKLGFDVVTNVKNLAQQFNRVLEVDFNNEEFTNPLLTYLKNYICCELVYNAIKFSPSSAVIKLSSHMENQTRIIEVFDEGAGFHASEADIKPFTKFVHRNDVPGLGLGLNNIKLIAQKLSGKIEIDSNNAGCTVRVTINNTIDI
jgi:DNA-binding response OmpR family regulator